MQKQDVSLFTKGEGEVLLSILSFFEVHKYFPSKNYPKIGNGVGVGVGEGAQQKEHLLLCQASIVGFPEPTLGGSQPPVIPVQRIWPPWALYLRVV